LFQILHNTAELHKFKFKKDNSSDDLTYSSTYLSVYIENVNC